MTRKDYVLIARVIANLDEIVDDFTREVIAEQFATALEATNPNFDFDRFFKACKMSDKHMDEVRKQLLK